MGDENTNNELTFASEEERQKALRALPEEPPRDVMDIDAWNAEVDRQRDQIENAKIGEAQQQQQKPADSGEGVPPPQTETPPAAPVDGELDFGKIKRSDLPEELRNYKSPGEIIKQFGHARKYANSLESSLEETRAKLQELQQTAEVVPNLQKEIEQLKKSSAQAQKTMETQPATPRQRASMATSFDELNKQLAVLDSMSEDEYVSAKTMRDTLKLATGELTNVGQQMKKIQDDFLKYRDTRDKEVTTLKTNLDGYLAQQKQDEKRKREEQVLAVKRREIEKLQDKFPELKTSKPVFSDNGDKNTVEMGAWRFADQISRQMTGAGLDSRAGWAPANQILNKYLRDDPDLVSFCANNGVAPESVGITKDDLRSYMTICNVDAHNKGYMYDEYTGQPRQVLNPINGQPVNFPDLETAYKYMLDKKGVTQAEINRMREEAEKRGQESLQRSLQKRDASPPQLGSEHSGSPEDAGHDMSEEEAKRILFATPEIEMKIEQGALNGDRYWFNMYNKAQKRLGFPENAPEEHWPPERKMAAPA